MRRGSRIRLAVATLLVRIGVALLAVACGELGHPHVIAPSSVAVTWVSAWIRRDVATMCRVETVHARGGHGLGTCQARLRQITGVSDTPWTYGRAGAIQIRRLPAGTAVLVSAPDTARGGHSFDWALLLVHRRGGRWLVADYHRVSGPARADPIGYYYGGTP